ncbi:Bet1-like SNARE 1-1, partial [Linum grandiflorum]
LFFSYQNRSRENRSSRSALFDDGLEEGGLRASSSFSSEIKEHDNDRAIDSLQDRVRFLKSLTGDIHEEVESHNRLLDRMVCGWYYSLTSTKNTSLSLSKSLTFPCLY